MILQGPGQFRSLRPGIQRAEALGIGEMTPGRDGSYCLLDETRENLWRTRVETPFPALLLGRISPEPKNIFWTAFSGLGGLADLS